MGNKPNSTEDTSGCKFNNACRPPPDGHHPAIARRVGEGCPFPQAVADLSWDRGTYLFHQGDRVKGGYSLRKGLVALERVDENGQLVVLKLLRPGAFFPCADLFADGLHANTARALTDTAACLVPAERLGTLFSGDPKLGLQIARRGCEEARENEDIIFRLCSGDLTERVVALLESLARESGKDARDGALSFTMPIAWRDLAAMVGTSPEVMSRMLRKLSDHGRLVVRGRQVTLPAARRSDREAG